MPSAIPGFHAAGALQCLRRFQNSTPLAHYNAFGDSMIPSLLRTYSNAFGDSMIPSRLRTH